MWANEVHKLAELSGLLSCVMMRSLFRVQRSTPRLLDLRFDLATRTKLALNESQPDSGAPLFPVG